jgi:hypothetical protein
MSRTGKNAKSDSTTNGKDSTFVKTGVSEGEGETRQVQEWARTNKEKMGKAVEMGVC